MPLVSIGLPVYNGENYIKEALESLLGQTHRDFEIIVSDNCSVDATVSIVRSYAEIDGRVSLYLQGKNIGGAGNFEFVFGKATGKYFMWAAHDDCWADNWLEVLLKNINTNDAGVRGIAKLQKNGKVVAEKVLPDFDENQYIRYFLRNETDYRSHYFYSLFYRDKLLRVNLSVLHLDYYPDALFVYDILKFGSVRTVLETHQIYRIHDFNAGEQYSKKWRGLAKIIYRVHPVRYYRYYLLYTNGICRKIIIFTLMPVKHVFAQISFWCRGVKQLITGKEYI